MNASIFFFKPIAIDLVIPRAKSSIPQKASILSFALDEILKVDIPNTQGGKSMNAMAGLLLLSSFHTTAAYHQQLSQVFRFRSLQYTSALYHIHSPAYCIEAHGFAPPGFRIKEASQPLNASGVIAVNFLYTTHFDERGLMGRMFSDRLNTSYTVLSDRDGLPVVFGTLSLKKDAKSLVLQANASMLRPPATVLESFLMCRGARSRDVQCAMEKGYSSFISDQRLTQYLSLVFERERERA